MMEFVTKAAVHRIRIVASMALLGVAGCANLSPTPTPGAARAGGAAAVSAGLSYEVFTAGQTPGFAAGAFALDIVAGPNGEMWFTDEGTPAIGRIAADGTVTEFANGLPAGALPYEIAPGPDGNMWFSDLRGVAIGRITPNGQIAEFSAPQFSDEIATGIAFGSDGTPWFITVGPQPLLAHLTATGKVRASRIPSHLSPDGSLASDAGGNLWFVATDRRAKAVVVERLPQGNLVRTPARLNQELTPCCPNVAPKRLVIGPDGHPWFTTLHYGYKRSGAAFIGTVGASGVTLLKVTRKGVHYAAYPSGLAQGSENLWFTGSDPLMNNGVLWRTDVHGNQTAYDVPYDPIGLGLDGNGNPWFTAFWSGLPSQIVKVTGLR